MKMFKFRKADNLEKMNRILTDAARKRSERIAELENEADRTTARIEKLEDVARMQSEVIQDLERQLAECNGRPPIVERQLVEVSVPSSPPVDRAKDYRARDLERIANERAAAVNDRDKQLAGLRDVATKYSLWAQQLDQLLRETGMRESERRLAWQKFVEALGVKYKSGSPESEKIADVADAGSAPPNPQ